MWKKIVGIFVCTLLLVTIIPISLVAETQSKSDIFDLTDSKIYISALYSVATYFSFQGFLPIILSFTPIYKNAYIQINLSSEDVYKASIIYINEEKQIFEEPVTIIIEDFNGIGIPFYISFFYLFRIILIGTGSIVINY